MLSKTFTQGCNSCSLEAGGSEFEASLCYIVNLWTTELDLVSKTKRYQRSRWEIQEGAGLGWSRTHRPGVSGQADTDKRKESATEGS